MKLIQSKRPSLNALHCKASGARRLSTVSKMGGGTSKGKVHESGPSAGSMGPEHAVRRIRELEQLLAAEKRRADEEKKRADAEQARADTENERADAERLRADDAAEQLEEQMQLEEALVARIRDLEMSGASISSDRDAHANPFPQPPGAPPLELRA